MEKAQLPSAFFFLTIIAANSVAIVTANRIIPAGNSGIDGEGSIIGVVDGRASFQGLLWAGVDRFNFLRVFHWSLKLSRWRRFKTN